MLRVGVFVDIGNIYYCIGKKFPGRKLDYAKYLDFVVNNQRLYTAKAYGTQLNEEAAGFINCLKKVGYEPIFKSLNGVNRRVHWDCQMTLDALRHLDRVDSIVIGSANPDLVPLVQACRDQGMQVIVCAAGISKELKAVASKWFEIDQDILEDKERKSEVFVEHYPTKAPVIQDAVKE